MLHHMARHIRFDFIRLIKHQNYKSQKWTFGKYACTKMDITVFHTIRKVSLCLYAVLHSNWKEDDRYNIFCE